jgi:uncharacterized protein
MVRALHPRTVEVTTEEDLTAKGDCIIGVGADKGCDGLNEELKGAIRVAGARVTVRISAGGETFVIRAVGSPQLSLSNRSEIVVRTTGFVSDRTLALNADFAARDIPRRMVDALRTESGVGYFEIEARR